MESANFSANINDTLESAAEFFKWMGLIAVTEVKEYSSRLRSDIVGFYDNISKANHKTYHKIKDIINSDKTAYARFKEGSKEVILGLIENLRYVNEFIWKHRAEAAALAIFVPIVGKLISPIILCTSIMIYALSKMTGKTLNQEETEILNMVQSANDRDTNDLWEKAQKINANEHVETQEIQENKRNLLKLANLNKDLLLGQQYLGSSELVNTNEDKFVASINRIESTAKEVHHHIITQKSGLHNQISTFNSSTRKHMAMAKKEGLAPSRISKLKEKKQKLQTIRKLKNKRSPWLR